MRIVDGGGGSRAWPRIKKPKKIEMKIEITNVNDTKVLCMSYYDYLNIH